VNYHADNGRFAEQLFLDHAELHGQGVSLCGVNVHFQNDCRKTNSRPNGMSLDIIAAHHEQVADTVPLGVSHFVTVRL
jgi:hypothetical protein